MKEVAVAVTGAGESQLFDLELETGNTAADVLASLDLEGYSLLPERGGAPFGRNENIYGKVEEGQKLFAVPDTEVGVQKGVYNVVFGATHTGRRVL